MTEEVVSSTVTATTITTTTNNNKSLVDDNIVNQPQLTVKGKKKQGAFGFLKKASRKLRGRSLDLKQQKFSQEVVPPADSKGENWKKLVGSVRPLHLQDNQSPPSSHPSPRVRSPSLPVECDEIFSSPYSPSSSTSSAGTISKYASANNLQELCSSSSSTSSVGTISKYASTSNLQELYDERNDNNEEDPDQAFDTIGADDMIDAKAENFIAQFYEQMRRQQSRN